MLARLEEEIKILEQVDDALEEINMIKRVLVDQEDVMCSFQGWKVLKDDEIQAFEDWRFQLQRRRRWRRRLPREKSEEMNLPFRTWHARKRQKIPVDQFVEFTHPSMRFFDRLQEDASRVRNSVSLTDGVKDSPCFRFVLVPS